jgi:gliding motility-associated lipoprotein GldD
MRSFLPVILCILILCSCGSEQLYNPKPRSFPKIEFPDRNYVAFNKDYCSFTFEYPDYAEIVKDKFFFDDKPSDECWFDISLSPFNGDLHCSYIALRDRAHFDKMVNDAFTMVGKHNIKAQYRDDFPLQKDGVSGMLFELKGDVASNLQFYLTDSINHFFRASLYFNSKVYPDSIAPIYDFVKQDVLNVIETFEWNE